MESLQTMVLEPDPGALSNTLQFTIDWHLQNRFLEGEIKYMLSYRDFNSTNEIQGKVYIRCREYLLLKVFI